MLAAVLALSALLLVVADYFGLLSSRTPPTPKLPVWAWIAILVLSYAAQLGIVYVAAIGQNADDAWRVTMPIPVLDDRGIPTPNIDAFAAATLVLAAIQSYALLALYRARPARAAVWTGCAVLLAMSFFAPALASFDLYGYVHDAVLGISAYNPPSVPFQGDYRFFDLWWTEPIPAFYGPLWLVIVKVATFYAPTLFWKIVALRGFSVALYVAMIAALRATGLPSRAVVVAALNPGMMLQYVADGHNDLIAIVLLLVAAALVRTRRIVALALLVVAGLVKLPYLALGIPILAAIRSVPKRFAWAAFAIAAVAALSWYGGGAPYLSALLGHVGQKTPAPVQYVAGIVALALVAAAFFGMRRYRTAQFIFPTISSWIFAWYLIWALPYAVARRRIAGFMLVVFPFAAMLVETSFERWWKTLIVLPLVALVWFFAPSQAARKETA